MPNRNNINDFTRDTLANRFIFVSETCDAAAVDSTLALASIFFFSSRSDDIFNFESEVPAINYKSASLG